LRSPPARFERATSGEQAAEVDFDVGRGGEAELAGSFGRWGWRESTGGSRVSRAAGLGPLWLDRWRGGIPAWRSSQ